MLQSWNIPIVLITILKSGQTYSFYSVKILFGQTYSSYSVKILSHNKPTNTVSLMKNKSAKTKQKSANMQFGEAT